MNVRVKWPKGIHKIPPIKFHRFLTGQGLKDSKEYIESLVVFNQQNGAVKAFYYNVETNRTADEINNELNHTTLCQYDASWKEICTKIETNGTQTFSVPNTQEGRLFIELARKYLNRNAYSQLRCRGRGERSKTHGMDLTVNEAEWLAVYVDDPDYTRIKRQQYYDELRQARESGKETALDSMPTHVLTEEAIKQIRGEALIEGREIGRKEGIREGKEEAAEEVLKALNVCKRD